MRQPARPSGAGAAAGARIRAPPMMNSRNNKQQLQLLALALLLPLLLAAAAVAQIPTTAAAAASTPSALAFVVRGGVTVPSRRRRSLVVLAGTEGAAAEGDPPTAVVIIPGYASDASQYRRLEASFRRRGIPAWTVPLSAPMWAPTFGGRSIRPVLDRLHATVLDVALKGRPLPPASGAGDDNGQRSPPPTPNPAGQYSLGAFLREMADPSQGAVFPVAEGDGAAAVGGLSAGGDGGGAPSTQMFRREELRYRVALVAHSAGGWISRLYLSTAAYDGRAYNGARFVSTLVTLGSPHVFPPRFRGAAKVPYALRNLQFVNDRCTGPAGGDWEQRVRCVCVGSHTVAGGRALGGVVKDWAGYSYEISGYDDDEGPVWGDGITPLESALGLPGAVARVELEGVYHGPEVEPRGQKWYGSDPQPLEQWLGYVLPDPAQWPTAATAAASTSSAAAASAATEGR